MARDVSTETISKCCEAEVYEEFMWPELMRKLEEERGINPREHYQAFTWVTFCKLCEKPCQTIHNIKS